MSSDLWAQPCGATIQGGSNQTLDCGSTLNGSGSGGGPYTYSWTPASGLSNPNIANPVVTTSGTYTLSVTGPNCSGTGTATVNVTVTPTPSMSSSAPAQTSTYNGVQAFVLCAAGVLSHTFDFTNTTTAPTGSEYTVVWGNGNTTTHSSNNWTSSQTYNLGLSQGAITVTLPNGCISSVPFYVFVGDVPLGGLAVITPSICTGGSIEFSWSGYTNNPPGTLYIVDYGDGTIETLTHPPAATLQHTYNVSSCTQPNGEFTVNWEISNPCDIRTGTINQIRVSEQPVAAFVLSPSDTVCVTTPVTFTDQSTGQQAPQCGDPNHIWTVTPGTYTVTGGILGSMNGSPNNPGLWTSGSDQLTVLFNAPGTYTITDVVGNACGTDTLVRVVCVEAPPVPNFTLAPMTGCSPLVANTTNNSVSNSCHLVRTWSAQQLTAGCAPQPGSVAFNALSNTPQFTFTGQGTYSVTLTLENTCGVFQQTVQPILVNGPPTISLSPIAPICQDDCIDLGPATVDDCDAPITTYGWTFANGTPNASAVQDPPQVCYPVAGTFNVTASVTNACGTASATQPLTVVPPPPVPTINGDLVLCAGESLVLTAPTGLSIYSWTGPAGASSNTNTLTIANVGPANAGTYTLTVGANNCTNTASVVVVVNPLPAPAISGPTAACSGDLVTLTLVNATGYASFSWSPGGATTPSITVPPGSYTVTVTDANGCSNTATHAVIGNPLPTVDAGDPLNPCIDSAPIPLTGGTPAGGTWSGTGVSAGSPQTFSPGLAGEGPHTLNYTYTDGNGCTNSDDVLATVRPLPTADAGPDAAVCAGNPLQLNGAASNGTPQYTYNWTPAANLNNPNIANPTFTYPPPIASPVQVALTLTVTDNFGCSATDAVTVTVNPAPVIDAGTDQEACVGSAPIPLGGTPVGGTWTGPHVSGPPYVFTPSTTGMFNLNYGYDDVNGCVNNDGITIVVHALPVATVSGGGIVCSTSPLPDVTFTFTGSAPWTFSYTDGGIPVIITNHAATSYTIPNATVGTYSVTALADAHCTGTDLGSSVTVGVSPAATADAGGPYLTCGTSAVPVNATANGPGAWSAPTGTFATTTATQTTYTYPNSVIVPTDVTLTWTTNDPDGSGPCPGASATAIVTVNPPATATLPATASVCGNASITLNATTNNPGSWSGGAGVYSDPSSPNTSYTPTSGEVGSTITLAWTTVDPDGNGPCEAAAASMDITVHPVPVADAGPDTTLCLNSGPVTLTGIPAGGTWSGPGVTSGGVFTPNTFGTFTLTYDYTDANNCADSDEMSITVNEAAVAMANGPYAVCGVEPIALNATTNGSGTWSGGAGTFANSSDPATTYTPAAGEVGSSIVLTWETFDPDGNGPCEGATSTAELTISTPAIAVPGGPYDVCSNSAVDISVTTTPGGGSWSGGSGIITNPSAPATTYTPASSEAGTAVALTWTTVDPDGNGPCPPVSATVTVNVLEAAIAVANGPYAVCGEEPVALNATTNGSGTWSGGAGTFANSGDPATTYTPAASEVGTSVVLTWETFDPDGSGPCEGASDTAELTISTPATAVPGGPYDVCSNSAVGISVTTTPGGGSWSGGSGTITDPSNPATIYTPASSEAGTAVVLTWTTVDPDGNGPCPPVSATVTVNVLEAAIAVANGPYAVCGAEPIALNATTNGSGMWSGGAGTFADSSDPATTYTPAAGEVGTNIVLTWETFDPDGPGPCEGASDTAELTISTPATAVPGGPYDVCSNSAVDISVTTTPGSGSWSGGSGTISDPSAPATTYTPASSEAGTAVALTWTTVDPDGNGPCPPVSATVTVNVLEAAIAMANGPYAVCGAEPITLNATTNGAGFWSGGSGVFANPFEPSTTYTATTTEFGSTVVLTWTTNDPDGNGPCTEAVDTAELQVHDLPVADAGADVTLACGDEITGTASGGGGPDYSFAWSPTTGLVAPNSATTPVTLTGTYVLLVTDVNGCTHTDSIDVTVTGLEDMAQADNVEVCLFDAVDLEGSAVDGLAPHTFLWTPPLYLNPPTGIGATIEFTYSQPLAADTVFTYTLTVTDAYGCADTTMVHVTVHPLPVVLVGADTSLCAYDPPFGLTGDPLGGTWAPSATVDPSALPFGPNTFEYTFTDINGCTNTDDLVVNVNEVPVVGISAPDTACVNTSVSFINQTSCPSCVNIGYLWDFGDNSPPSTLVSPQHTYADTGLYVVTLIAGSGFGCSDTATHTIRIIRMPEVGFTFTPESGCGPLEVELTNTSQGLPITYLWNIESFGTSSLENPGPITFPAAPCDSTYYTIALIASNQCGVVSAVDSVKTYSPPQPLLVVSADTVCSPFTIEAYNETVCAWATTYGWDFGDGTTSSSQTLLVSNVYTADSLPETYPLTLSASNVCGTVSVTHNIVVYPNTVTAFFNTAPLVGCEPLPVQFDQSLLGVTFWSWDFGDGNTSVAEDPLHVYENAGTYIVTLVVSNGCALDTMTQTVTVNPAPIFDFVADPDTLCVLQPTSFTPLGDNITGFQWSFGDGATSTMTNPTHAYAQEGTYQVSLTAFSTLNGCPATVIHPVVVLTTPEASVTAIPSEGCAPLTVNFDGFTSIGDLFVWDFGDGNTAQGASPVHTYLGEGTYSAQVVASNINGCSDTANAVITVFPLPIAAFSYEMEVSPEAILPVAFENQSIGAYGYQWYFGDGHSSTFNDPAHVYDLGRSCYYEPMLIATNEYGCKDTAVKVMGVPWDLRIWAPNAFSPDGNGLNEEFVILGADWELTTVHLMIFDRWGELIHETKGVTPAWDGRMNGKVVKNDVYVWKVKAQLKCGYDEVEHIGHVTVVR